MSEPIPNDDDDGLEDLPGPMAAAAEVLTALLECITNLGPETTNGDFFPGAWNDEGPLGQELRKDARHEFVTVANDLNEVLGTSLTASDITIYVRLLATLIENVGAYLQPMRRWAATELDDQDETLKTAEQIIASESVSLLSKFMESIAVGPQGSWGALNVLVGLLIVVSQ